MILMGNDREKERKKERKRRGSRKYGQAKYKHSRKGVWSCVTAAAVAVLLLTLIGLAYVSRGKAAGYIGGLGVSAVILSCVGIDLGIRGFREREKNYRTCKFGIGFSIFFLVSLILFFVGGFM